MPASATLRRPHSLADTQFEAAHVLGFQPLARHPSTYTLELETVANVGLYIIEGTYRLLMVIIRSIFRVLEVACSCGAVFFSFLVDVVDTLDSAITTVARAIVVTIRGSISICNAIAWCAGALAYTLTSIGYVVFSLSLATGQCGSRVAGWVAQSFQLAIYPFVVRCLQTKFTPGYHKVRCRTHYHSSQ
ncbi:hypothetical protein C8Q80DRAFT_914856 [Daedaleopsis nitida]|nr:hypothetical protein C8Q80DRAFT_914856 [Daedaleopsis nitida]